MVGEATLITVLRLHVEIQLCRSTQKSNKVILQSLMCSPIPISVAGGWEQKTAGRDDETG